MVMPPAGAQPSRWNLVGKTALVTGATKGIGRAIAEELAGLGARVYICARSESDVKERVQEWKEAGLAIDGSVCDVSSLDSCKQLIAAVSDHFAGKLDILVNNAGIMTTRPSIEASPDYLSLIMRTNFESGFHMSRLAHPLLKASGQASIVFNSSNASIAPTRIHCALYSASKGALNQLTKSFACEWAKDGIRVNAVAPGYTHSDFLDKELTEEITTMIHARTPLRRIGEAKEIAGTVAFLCMPCSYFTTGVILTVDGGMTAHHFATPCPPIEK